MVCTDVRRVAASVYKVQWSFPRPRVRSYAIGPVSVVVSYGGATATTVNFFWSMETFIPVSPCGSSPKWCVVLRVGRRIRLCVALNDKC